MRHRALLVCVHAALAVLACGPSAAFAQANEETVRVDCARGQSIARALMQRPNAAALTIEIAGVCTENVVVTRDRVTLRGGDPAQDGIQASANVQETDAALWVRGAHLVTVENLKLTGGRAGLLATEASTLYLRLAHVRIEANTRYGLELQESLVQAEDSVFTGNGYNVGAFQGSRFECTNCELSNPQLGQAATVRTNVIGASGAILLMRSTTITDGGLNLNNGSASLQDSSVVAFGNGAALADTGNQTTFTRVSVTGHVVINSGSNTQFYGVTQQGALQPNTVDNSSFLRIADASSAMSGGPAVASSMQNTSLKNFSNASMAGLSHVQGSLSCSQAANAYCSNTANVSGSSNCALCLKP